MWKKFLGKKANIIGVELNPEAKKLEKYGFTTFNESYLFKNAEEQIIELKNKSSSPHKALTGFLNRFIEF